MAEGVTLFVPVYNEEEILTATMRRLFEETAALGRTAQIIVVDNGSTDRTPAILRSIASADERVVALRLPERGVGAALRAALPYVEHRFVVALDADLTIDLAFLGRSVALLADGCDVVVGSKESGRQDRAWARRLTSHVFVWTMQRGLAVPFRDVSIGAKAYRLDVLRAFEPLIGRGSSYVLEVLLAAHRKGMRIADVPVRCRDTRRSHFNLLHEGVHRFGHLFRLVLAHRLRLARRSGAEAGGPSAAGNAPETPTDRARRTLPAV